MGQSRSAGIRAHCVRELKITTKISLFKQYKMAIYAVDESQSKAARVAGILYLSTIVTANLTEFYVRHQLMVHGDAWQTIRNIAAHEQLFRLGIASDLLMLARKHCAGSGFVRHPQARQQESCFGGNVLVAGGMLRSCGHTWNRFRSSALSNRLQALAGPERGAVAIAGTIVDQPGCRRKSGCRFVFRTRLDLVLLSLVQVAVYSSAVGSLGNPCVAGANFHTFVHHCLCVLGRSAAAARSNWNPDCYL